MSEAPLHRPGRGQRSDRCGDDPPPRLRQGIEQFNRGEFFEIFQVVATGGETTVESVAIYRISAKTGLPWVRPTWQHAEQVLYTAAEELGLVGSRVASSIPGCWTCSIEALRFGIWHVNPSPID